MIFAMPTPTAAMSTRARLLPFLLLLAAAGCTPAGDAGKQADQAGTAGSPSSGIAPDSERVWSGLLPCSDCQGIDTRLVLRYTNGRRAYVMTETYLGGAGKNSFNRAGTWTEIQHTVDGEPQVTYVLDPDRSGQKFQLQPDGALEMLGVDGKLPEQPVVYRLQRL
jgi:copper homeostasis protein (lipoprotein)